MKLALSTLLGVNGGYVDTAGFLALSGLFTAHVTGNFVTFGVAMALGTSGIIGKLLALPVYCAAVMLVRLAGGALQRHGRLELRSLLGLQVPILAAGCASAIAFGPFEDADAWLALLTGMLLVAAMAVQNATHRLDLLGAPPTTLMTGTTTQIMIDVADILRGVTGPNAVQLRSRLSRMTVSVLSFALGCAGAAFIYSFAGLWCFAIPPCIALLTLFVKGSRSP